MKINGEKVPDVQIDIKYEMGEPVYYAAYDIAPIKLIHNKWRKKWKTRNRKK